MDVELDSLRGVTPYDTARPLLRLLRRALELFTGQHRVSVWLTCFATFRLVYGIELFGRIELILLVAVLHLTVACAALLGAGRWLYARLKRDATRNAATASLRFLAPLVPLGVIALTYTTQLQSVLFLARHRVQLKAAIEQGSGLYVSGLFDVQFEVFDTVDGITYMRAGNFGWDDSLWLLHCADGPLTFERYSAALGHPWGSKGFFRELTHVNGPWYSAIH